MTTQQFELKIKTEDLSVGKIDIFLRLNELKAQNARFQTITALDHGEELEVIYNFERGTDEVNLHVRTPKKEPIPSITGVFPSAFIAENEVQEHFNVKVSGINVDFGEDDEDRGSGRGDAPQAGYRPRAIHKEVLRQMSRGVPGEGERPEVHQADTAGETAGRLQHRYRAGAPPSDPR